MNEYSAKRYKGREWGIWGRTSRCFIIFGPRVRMISRAAELNRMPSMARSEERARDHLMAAELNRQARLFRLRARLTN